MRDTLSSGEAAAEPRETPADEVAQSQSWGADFLRRSSSRLLRTTSATATGGAGVIPAALSEPLLGGRQSVARQVSRREAAMNQVRQQVMEELTNFVTRRLGWIVALFLTLMCLCFVSVYLVVGALYAFFVYGGLPCDQPLQMYLLVLFALNPLWTQVATKVAQCLRRSLSLGLGATHCVSVLLASSIVWWGLYMVCAAKTCPETNPGLYYPMKHFIYGQIIISCISLITSAVALFGLRRLLQFVSSLDDQRGCLEAVRGLPRVPHDSEELIDPEDGQAIECPICFESFGASEQVVLRAPCEHLFHEECLASWCKNHVTCPLCRQQVGDYDSPSPSNPVPPV